MNYTEHICQKYTRGELSLVCKGLGLKQTGGKREIARRVSRRLQSGGQSLRDQLFDAAKTGKTAKLTEILKDNPNLGNIKDNKGDTLFRIAVDNLRQETAIALINLDADYVFDGSRYDNDWTGAGEKYEIINNVSHAYLARARIRRVENDKLRLFEVAKSGNINKLEIILEKHPTWINNQDHDKRTPLYYASRHGYLDIVKFLVNKGAKVNIKEGINSTPLHFAAMGGHPQIIEFLVNNGAEVNAKDYDEETPLHYAARKGYCETAVVLVNQGAKIGLKNIETLTPMALARKHDHSTTAYIIEQMHQIAWAPPNPQWGTPGGVQYLKAAANWNKNEDSDGGGY